ncbi:hypothetical protein J6590_061726 [Homalodisca vitripennis]|nr:hypothetical protein J6590_061726 [Homalodisca vitripennis]
MDAIIKIHGERNAASAQQVPRNSCQLYGTGLVLVLTTGPQNQLGSLFSRSSLCLVQYNCLRCCVSSLHSILLYGDDYVPLPWATSSSFHNSHQTRPCPPRQ